MNRCTTAFKVLILLVAIVALCAQPILAKEDRPVGAKSFKTVMGGNETIKKDFDQINPNGDPEAMEVNPNEVAVPQREGFATGDNCTDPIKVTLPAQLPYADLNQTTCGRVNDYQGYSTAYCLSSSTSSYSYTGGEDIIYEVTVTSAVTVSVSVDFKTTTYGGFSVDNTCPMDASCLGVVRTSSAGLKTVGPLTLAPGVYYIMVDTWPTPTCVPAFDLKIATYVPPDPINCANPLTYTIGAANLPFLVSNLSTCTHVNDYSNTCMGYYDGGEDVMIKLIITDPIFCDLTLNPGTTTYGGMAIDDVCPLDIATGSCIGFVGTSSAAPKSITGLTLNPGTYYVMVDTWSTPDCIPNFSFGITGGTPPPANDNCANATPVGDVTNLAFNTTAATNDGPTDCIATGVRNVWFKYTAPSTGNATISTCNSLYDTKMAIYDGSTCPPTTLLNCSDDVCGSDGYKASATISVVAGHQYLIDIGGYSSTYFGQGYLDISTAVAPPNDDCAAVTPVTLTPGVPTVFNGDNTGAASDCASFPGNNAWEAFTITECSDVTLSYCGTTPAFENAWLNLAQGCPCATFTPGGAFDVTTCPDGNVTIVWSGLAAGTYYYPVLTEPGAVGPYTITVVANTVSSYCDADGYCDEYISRVQLSNLDNSSSCGASYEDYTSLSATVLQTVAHTLTITNGYPYSSDQCGAWIDWNGDKCFDASEKLTTTGGPATFTAIVTPPITSVTGPTRMRIRIMYTGTMSPCGTASYGEVEDYTINIEPLVPKATIAPSPQYLYFIYAVTPITDAIRFGNWNDGHTAADVNLATVTVNGLPVTASVVPSYAGFAGASVLAELPLTTFLAPYGTLYDINNLTFTVAWDWNDASPSSITDDVVIIGKSSPVPGRFIVPDGNIVYVPGDFDLNGLITVSDPVAIISYIFAGGVAPSNTLVGDMDCSGLVTISDAVYAINYIFAGGAAPCAASN